MERFLTCSWSSAPHSQDFEQFDLWSSLPSDPSNARASTGPMTRLPQQWWWWRSNGDWKFWSIQRSRIFLCIPAWSCSSPGCVGSPWLWCSPCSSSLLSSSQPGWFGWIIWVGINRKVWMNYMGLHKQKRKIEMRLTVRLSHFWLMLFLSSINWSMNDWNRNRSRKLRTIQNEYSGRTTWCLAMAPSYSCLCASSLCFDSRTSCLDANRLLYLQISVWHAE